MVRTATPTPEVALGRGQRVAPGHAEWRSAIAEVLRGEGLGIAVQPIVDLCRGEVVGYEALARFTAMGVTPDAWFATAGKLGMGPELDVRAFEAGLARRTELPPNCFLSLNISPATLLSPEGTRSIAAADSLEGVVIELTEHDAITDYGAVLVSLERLRRRGAKIAVDDAGSGYSGLQWLAAIRPDLVKVDRALVADVDRDTTKVAMLEMLGALAGHMDAWLLAEGVERVEELDALVRLGVPLAQGYLLARPSLDGWPTVTEPMSAHMRRGNEGRDGDTVRSLVDLADPAHSVDEAAARLGATPGLDFVAVVDERSRPVGIVAAAAPGELQPVLTIKTDEAIDEVTKRCLTRSLSLRWHPPVCVDELGQYVGMVRSEQMVHHLLARSEGNHL